MIERMEAPLRVIEEELNPDEDRPRSSEDSFLTKLAGKTIISYWDNSGLGWKIGMGMVATVGAVIIIPCAIYKFSNQNSRIKIENAETISEIKTKNESIEKEAARIKTKHGEIALLDVDIQAMEAEISGKDKELETLSNKEDEFNDVINKANSVTFDIFKYDIKTGKENDIINSETIFA